MSLRHFLMFSALSAAPSSSSTVISLSTSSDITSQKTIDCGISSEPLSADSDASIPQQQASSDSSATSHQVLRLEIPASSPALQNDVITPLVRDDSLCVDSNTEIHGSGTIQSNTSSLSSSSLSNSSTMDSVIRLAGDNQHKQQSSADPDNKSDLSLARSGDSGVQSDLTSAQKLYQSADEVSRNCEQKLSSNPDCNKAT